MLGFFCGGNSIREGRMRQRLLAGICLLAFTFAASGVADAAKRKAHHSATNCAQPSEISAIQATAIQQQLMVAALSCDQTDASGGKQRSEEHTSELQSRSD